MLRRPRRSTLFPSRRSSDLVATLDRALEHRRAVEEPRLTGDRQHQFARALVLGADRRPDRPAQRLVLHQLRVALDRKSTRLNSSHVEISYAVFCLKKKKQTS